MNEDYHYQWSILLVNAPSRGLHEAHNHADAYKCCAAAAPRRDRSNFNLLVLLKMEDETSKGKVQVGV